MNHLLGTLVLITKFPQFLRKKGFWTQKWSLHRAFTWFKLRIRFGILRLEVKPMTSELQGT